MDRARNAEESVSPLSFQDQSVAFGFDVGVADSHGLDASVAWGHADEAVATAPTEVAEAIAVQPAPAPVAGLAGVWYASTKRFLDVVICLAILPLVVPLAGLIALAIKLDSPGPVVFRQTRIGRHGRPFQILKFRSLPADHDQTVDRAYMEAFIRGLAGLGADGDHVVNKPIRSSTATRVGRFLRRSSLDELPQIVNVLNGEMSLVGPRPNVPWEVGVYLDWHRERLEVTPGITGLAQIRGRSCVTFDTIAASDIEYVRRRSISLDLDILWRTAVCLFNGDGAG